MSKPTSFSSTYHCMCTKCLNMRKYCYTVGANSIEINRIGDKSVYDRHPFYYDFGECIDGEDHNIVLLDDRIADVVQFLNIKGYKTVSSCEGHMVYPDNGLSGKIYSITLKPYISLHPSVPARIFNSLPDGWCAEYDIRNNEVVMYYDCSPTNSIVFDQKSIYEWVRELPYNVPMHKYYSYTEYIKQVQDRQSLPDINGGIKDESDK